MLLNYKNEITILYNGADACPVRSPKIVRLRSEKFINANE